LNTRPGITQPPQHHVKDTSSNQQTKQKYKPSHQQTQTTGPTLGGGQKPKGRKNSTFFKERIQLPLKPGKRRPQTQ